MGFRFPRCRRSCRARRPIIVTGAACPWALCLGIWAPTGLGLGLWSRMDLLRWRFRMGLTLLRGSVEGRERGFEFCSLFVFGFAWSELQLKQNMEVVFCFVYFIFFYLNYFFVCCTCMLFSLLLML